MTRGLAEVSGRVLGFLLTPDFWTGRSGGGGAGELGSGDDDGGCGEGEDGGGGEVSGGDGGDGGSVGGSAVGRCGGGGGVGSGGSGGGFVAGTPARGAVLCGLRGGVLAACGWFDTSLSEGLVPARQA